MARPKKIVAEQFDSIESTETPQEALTSLSEAFFVQDPTSKVNKRIMRLHSAEECERYIKRGWVLYG